MRKKAPTTFQEWIDTYGVNALSTRLGVKPATIRHWRIGRVYPRVEQMKAIYKISNGIITYTHIIERRAL